MAEGHARPDTIRWRVLLRAGPADVFRLLSTSEGRTRFWAESAPEAEGRILFRFPNGKRVDAQLLECDPPKRFSITYFGGSRVEFTVAPTADGKTVLTVEESGVAEESVSENSAGWVSVLLALKAAVDFGVDLRNHDPDRNWDQGFVDN